MIGLCFLQKVGKTLWMVQKSPNKNPKHCTNLCDNDPLLTSKQCENSELNKLWESYPKISVGPILASASDAPPAAHKASDIFHTLRYWPQMSVS